MMRQTNSLICLLLSLVATTFCWAQSSSTQDDSPGADQRILHEIQERNQLMENIEFLSDSIGPRLTGSEQLKAAEAWAANAAREYSLENVHLEGWTIAALVETWFGTGADR
jgi:carboxypeptidase Q